jgi:hypothetical protein
MGALSPKDLWEGVQFQVKEIVYTVFQWDEGQFHFEESSLPEKERITVDLDIQDLDPGRPAPRGRGRARAGALSGRGLRPGARDLAGAGRCSRNTRSTS